MKTPNRSSAVWVVAEVDDCRLRSVSLQLVGKARQLADQLDVTVEALLLGNQLNEPARELIAAGADRVYTAESPELALYQPEAYADVIVSLTRTRQPQILLMGSTF